MHDVHHDSSEVSQVELVVELLSSRHEHGIVGNGQEHFHSGIYNFAAERLNLVVEVGEVVLQNLIIDGVEDFFFSSQAREQREMSLQSSVNEEGP